MLMQNYRRGKALGKISLDAPVVTRAAVVNVPNGMHGQNVIVAMIDYQVPGKPVLSQANMN